MLEVDHVGIVVPDLSAAVRWWLDALPGWQVDSQEPWGEVSPSAVGLATRVRLCGAIVRPVVGGSGLEIHQVGPPWDGRDGTRRMHDHGLGHLALRVRRDRMDAEGARLARLGVTWLARVQEVGHGPARGCWWRYGRPPVVAGDVVLEIRSAAPSVVTVD